MFQTPTPVSRVPQRGTSQLAERFQAVIETPIPGSGRRLGVRIEDGTLAAIELLGTSVALRSPAHPLAEQVARQLEGYFAAPGWRFSLPLALQGTPYQRRVWDALGRIPVGESVTYGELALEVGGGARAVGNACRANPVPIVVPCHRVVSRCGLAGYMGATCGDPLASKAWLLAHESGG